MSASTGQATAAQDPQVRRGRLFRRYFLFIMALVCGALLASGGISLYGSYQENKLALARLEKEKAVAAAARIEQFIKGIEQQLGFAALPQLGSEGVEQRRVEFLKLLRQAPAVTDITQLDDRGQEALTVSRLAMDNVGASKDRALDPAFLNARPGKPWIGPVYFRKETEPYFTVGVRAGTGVTVAEVNLKFVWDVVSRIRIGEAGKAYVIDAGGALVADPDIGLVLRKTDVSNLEQIKAALNAKSNDEPAMVARSVNGTEVLTAWAPIETLGWQVFVEQPVSEVYATLNASIVRTGLLLLIGLAVSAIVSTFLARSMVRPIRVLQEGAQRIGEGELDQRIEVRTNDELETLAEQFNQMTARLRESYAGLERKVEERTAALERSLEHRTATAEILRVISQSMDDPRPVFQAITERTSKLFGGEQIALLLAEGDKLLLGGAAGDTALSPAVRDEIAAKYFPKPLTRETSSGLAILDRRVVEIADVEAPEIIASMPNLIGLMRASGYRSELCVPMIRGDQAIGTISVNRTTVGGFSATEVELLKTFADQAVIAIENARLFNEIREKSRQLELANQHKSEFLANMSHELRTPLNAVIGFSEVLSEGMFGELNEKQLDYVQDIHASGRHLLSLINDILDLSKIEAGRMELEVGSFDLPSAIGNAVTLVRERAQRHGIELKTEVGDDLGECRGDERKFKQIMLNLLSNAVKFTGDGGRVTVACHRNGETIEVSVADTGIGIAPEDQPKVFEEFVQVGSNYATKREGTGLGLPLARRFVELHGGRMWLESTPGAGSTFFFSLPLQQGAQEEAAA
ncbi:MAG: HAMP domain-containing protein [Burkholderiales bacterium]|nr:HAMP domain-containing protein [Burkholderiales bacterium]